MAGRAEVAAFARKCKQIFIPAVRTSDTGETMVQITAAWLSSLAWLRSAKPGQAATLKITVDDLFGIGTEERRFIP